MAAAVAALVLAAAGPAFAAEPLKVVATTGMVADVVSAVGGECVAVTTLIADGSDPHSYMATPSDVAALRSADWIVQSGLNLEGRLSDVLAALARTRPVLALAEEGVPESERLAKGEGEGEGEGGSGAPVFDPHVWMDARLWGATAQAAARSLGALRPDCAAAAEANAAAYAAEAAALDGWIRAAIASIPAERRRLVTAHDAFGYFSRAYAIPVAAIQGISTETEAALSDIEAVAALIAGTGVPAVFVESTIAPRTIEAVIEAARARGHSVTIGGTLFADAMGAAGSPEGTWTGMLRANALAITAALGGTPPAWPAELSGWAARNGVAP